MIKKAINISAAVAFVAAAVGVVVVALAYTVFALAREVMTPAGSAATVAGVFAVVLAIGAFWFLNKDKPRHDDKPAPTMAEKAMEFVRQRPVVSAAGLVAVSIIAFRNPALIATLAAAAIAEKPDPRKKR